jgi:hypothetical protein
MAKNSINIVFVVNAWPLEYGHVKTGYLYSWQLAILLVSNIIMLSSCCEETLIYPIYSKTHPRYS